MNKLPLYLRPNVQVEPLWQQWYAWSHLIAPATACRNITGRHLKIMNSYVSSPKLHFDATKNPEMRGGPFIDYDRPRVDEIRQLIELTEKMSADLLQLSSAILELNTMLQREARGYSLRALYDRVPTALRGYVELVYDLNNHPSFRFIEPLIYRRYYDRGFQSIMLSLIQKDERPFVLSTPRLDSGDAVHLKVAFDDELIDWLFERKTAPADFSEICQRCAIDGGEQASLKSMFTTSGPRGYRPYEGKGIRWRYFGHACILIETRSIKILFDPVLSYTYENGISRYTYEDLPDDIDYVVITHNHQDHILFETLLQIRHKTRHFIVPRNRAGALHDPSLKLILENCGFQNVIDLQELESIEFEGGSITGLPFLGEHADLDVYSKLGYLVRISGYSLLMLADSCNVDSALYENVHRVTGDVSVIFLGMECDGAPLSWVYGPLLTQPIERSIDMSRRLSGCNFQEARRIVMQFNPKEVYVYAMGQEPWLNYIMSVKYSDTSRPIVESNLLIAECHEKGIVAERLFGEKEICHE